MIQHSTTERPAASDASIRLRPLELRAADFRRIPRHVGFIPDGNRRWAEGRGLAKSAGYDAGIAPGLTLIRACDRLGVEEISIYGFTKENTHRPREQVAAFQDACVDFARRAVDEGAALQVVGDVDSPSFPWPLRSWTERSPGRVRVNLVVDYTWSWDLGVALAAVDRDANARPRDVGRRLGSSGVSRVDLVVRWGGRRRLSGFLPMQTAYADLYVVDALWPDMRIDELASALRWYGEQDVTLGG